MDLLSWTVCSRYVLIEEKGWYLDATVVGLEQGSCEHGCAWGAFGKTCCPWGGFGCKNCCAWVGLVWPRSDRNCYCVRGLGWETSCARAGVNFMQFECKSCVCSPVVSCSRVWPWGRNEVFSLKDILIMCAQFLQDGLTSWCHRGGLILILKFVIMHHLLFLLLLFEFSKFFPNL